MAKEPDNSGNQLIPTAVFDGANDYGYGLDSATLGSSQKYLYAVQDISAGFSHAGVVNYAGYVLAWGNNNRSQLGNFDSTSCEGQPIQVGTERYLALEPTYTEFFHNSESPSRKETFSSTGANKPPLSKIGRAHV